MSKKTVSGTKEWSATSENVIRGCSNGCLYCYGCAYAFRFNLKERGTWTQEEVNEKAQVKGFGKRKGTIMFPTMHDLTPENMNVTVPFLKRILKAGNDVLVVSKPHPEVIQKICDECEEYKDQILFRFTIGSMDSRILSFWEPGAPLFPLRFNALCLAFGRGFKTSVSMEPLLETVEDNVVELVENLQMFVIDAIWIGKMNRLEERLKRNGHWDDWRVQAKATALVASQEDGRIRSLYERLKDNPKVKWKESIKKVIGIEVPTEAGLDI